MKVGDEYINIHHLLQRLACSCSLLYQVATCIQGTTLIAFGGERVALYDLGEHCLGDEVWNVASRDFSIRMYCALRKSATELQKVEGE